MRAILLLKNLNCWVLKSKMMWLERKKREIIKG